MKTNINILHLFVLFLLVLQISNKDVIHFLNTGDSDCILFESQKHFGLIDSSTNLKRKKNPLKEVVSISINATLNEKLRGSRNKDESVDAVIKYLRYLEVIELDFVILTNAHDDHIGGIPALANKFINKNTKIYYRKYRPSIEDITMKKRSNFPYYRAAILSARKKGAEMIDVTNQEIKFTFGDLEFQILNTELDEGDYIKGENHHSLVTFVKFGDKKLLFPGDMTIEEEDKIFNKVGKVDIYKVSNHGFSDNSLGFLKKLSPSIAVFTSKKIGKKAAAIVSYLQNKLQTEVLCTGKAKKASKKISGAAIKINLNSKGGEYKFKLAGKRKPIKINDRTGWFRIQRNKMPFEPLKMNFTLEELYIQKGKYLTGLKQLNKIVETEEEKITANGFYFFNEEGIMQKGLINVNNTMMYFNETTGKRTEGWAYLTIDGKYCAMYFDEEGKAIMNKEENIDDILVTFDKNGCLTVKDEE
ncbi:MAG: MBL fold metallo-hydrolase, partial [archaeon]|nr:MBL fold metallo-hydrolase [archaeon]